MKLKLYPLIYPLLFTQILLISVGATLARIWMSWWINMKEQNFQMTEFHCIFPSGIFQWALLNGVLTSVVITANKKTVERFID